MAETARDGAMAAAMAELKIVEKTKTVGETSITIDGQAHSQTINDKTLVTGLMDMAPVHMDAGEDDGMEASAGPPVVNYKQAVAGRDVEVGVVYDSSNDEVRLMLITSYAGSKRVKVYTRDVDRTADEQTTDNQHRLSIDVTSTGDVTEEDNVRLRSAGMHYFAGDPENSDEALEYDDTMAEDAKAKQVYSYVDPNTETTIYVVLHTQSTTDGVTMYTYRPVDVLVNHDADTGDDATAEITPTAEIASKTDYEHIHFGVWAGLGGAEDDGTQMLDDLGIAFVHNYSATGMTAVMPNHGSATYNGNWAAAVQGADPDGNGEIRLESGIATMMANFGLGKVTATLTGLAELEGDIAGSQFSGDDASVMDGDPYDLNSAGEFEGTLSGAFYGDKAAEAGGVFDFMSEDMEAGAFRGAFGGGQE